MSKKSIIARQKKRELLVARYIFQRNELKKNILTADNFNKKFSYQVLLQRLPRNSSLSRLFRLN